MGKIPTKYLETDDWKIIEKGFHSERGKVSESIFSLSNEHMGVRGTFEEGISADTLTGNYFNGVYEYAKKAEEGAYKGIARRTHFMVNSVNWLAVNILVDGERLDLARCTVSDFYRELDMRTGIYTRSFKWLAAAGAVNLKFTRFLDMQNCERGYQQIEICPEKNVKAEITLSLDSNVLHWGKDCYWKHHSSKSVQNAAVLRAETLTTGQFVTSGMGVDYNVPFKASNVSGSLLEQIVLEADLTAGQNAVITRYVTNLVSKSREEGEQNSIDKCLKMLTEQRAEGISAALERSKKYWKDFWAASDIEIDGDKENQQGIRYCIFQLQQTYHGYDARNNIGAKGLTGEAYSGHAFWDTETYCLPYYLFNNIKAARDLLLFRYHTLDRAKDRARELDCKGACYPIATLNGAEACTLWQHASLQFQPSTGVAYGIWHYCTLTGDEDFLFGYGLEMLVEISRFLYSRGDWNADKTHFGFYCVMGPDEFQMMVNHNAYTNYLAKKTFEFTLDALKSLEKSNSGEYIRLTGKLNLKKEETESFAAAAEKMLILYDGETMLFEQHKGYFDLPHIDVDSIPVKDFPLYHNWSYDRIYRNDMIKQPDVLMFMLMYNQEFDTKVLKANYDFYEPRTIHESSLSPSVHSVLASQLGYEKQALDFFGFATRMDLDDYNRNTCEGLHTTSIAAAWLNIVYGFGGLRSGESIISVNPVLPEIWNKYAFSVITGGEHIRITVTKDNVRITSDGKSVQKLKIYGKVYEFSGLLEVKREFSNI